MVLHSFRGAAAAAVLVFGTGALGGCGHGGSAIAEKVVQALEDRTTASAAEHPEVRPADIPQPGAHDSSAALPRDVEVGDMAPADLATVASIGTTTLATRMAHDAEADMASKEQMFSTIANDEERTLQQEQGTAYERQEAVCERPVPGVVLKKIGYASAEQREKLVRIVGEIDAASTPIAFEGSISVSAACKYRDTDYDLESSAEPVYVLYRASNGEFGFQEIELNGSFKIHRTA